MVYTSSPGARENRALPWRISYGEIIGLGIALVLASEVLRRVLGRIAKRTAPSVPLKARAKRWLEIGFATLTFPLVLLIYVSAAIWLLPYVLLSKPYRLHLAEARKRRREEWPSLSPFSRQLASLDVTDFLTLPFRPIFAFLDWLERRPQRLNLSKEPPSQTGRPVISERPK